ncbi:MAG: hypothetical protein O3A63_17795 [Proteobacteria bacterium]|nr:hypothetical protein [Pseudomonadota bacterium]
MKVAVRTDEYTIYQKRSGRYAVRGADRNWVNGEAKTAALLANKLIAAPKVKAPVPVAEEPAAGEPAAEEGSPEA